MSDNQQQTSILYARVDESLPQSLTDLLKNAGYELHTTHSWNETELALALHQPDIMLASASEDSHQFFGSVRNHFPYPPLMIMLTEEQKYLNNGHHTVDLALPPVDNIILQQLPYMMSLHEESIRLRKEKEALTQMLAGVQRELDDKRHISNEAGILKNAIVNLSHELKTPLLQVKSAVSLIAEDFGNDTLIAYALNATGRLETHVKNITMLGSSLDIHPTPIILRDTIDYARRNLGRVWERRSEADRIQVNVDDKLPPVLADKQGLSTVLQLLIDNALKFSREPIEVSAKMDGEDYVCVMIKDHGIGIEKDRLEIIFETFYQVDSQSTRRYSGAGVGLALVKLILDHHNITIHVKSEPSKGSSFWFKLPVATIS